MPSANSAFAFSTVTLSTSFDSAGPSSLSAFFTVIERRNASEDDESVFNVVHSGRYVEIDKPRRLAFDLSVLAFSDETTRVTVEIASTTPQTCEVTVKHELGSSRHAFAIEESTRRSWTNMLALLERELFPRRIGVHL